MKENIRKMGKEQRGIIATKWSLGSNSQEAGGKATKHHVQKPQEEQVSKEESKVCTDTERSGKIKQRRYKMSDNWGTGMMVQAVAPCMR